MVIDKPAAIGAGASGALFGVLGSMVAWLFLNRRILPRAQVAHWQRQLITVFVINLFITFGIPNISKGAHIGGAIVGLMTAVPLYFVRFRHGQQRWLALAGLVAIPLACTAAVRYSFANSAEVGQQLQGPREQREFIDRHLTKFCSVLDEMEQLLANQVKPLLDQRPDRRDAAALKSALAALTANRDRFDRLLDPLRQAGPYSDARVENQRQFTLSVAEQLPEILRVASDRLERGQAWAPRDERSLDIIVGRARQVCGLLQ
jgi:hypothetical protein